MDSLSQFALGAAIGEATLGSKLGRKAIIVGGLLGTLPDLDVVVRYTDAVAGFTYHRSWSHSIIVLTLISPMIAWLLYRFFPPRWGLLAKDQHMVSSSGLLPEFRQWLVAVWLILITHAILDGFTIYGTQLFWPIPMQPVAIGSIFIIDPAYTIPLLVGLLVAWRYRQHAQTAVVAGLIVSTAYLAVTLLSQHNARQIAIASLKEQGLPTNNVLVAPAPFSVFWRVVSMDKDNFHEGFYSVFDENQTVQVAPFETNRHLIDNNYAHWPLSRLDWFTDGMISADASTGALVINDLRMGIESSYVFRFSVGMIEDQQLTPTISTLLPMEIDQSRMTKLWHRVTDESVDVSP